MFKFLKKIFQEEDKETKQITEISLHNMEEWLKEKSKPLAEEIRQKTDAILMRASEEAQKARFNVEVLESAKLQNPNIPFRAKQYMEGNRKSYIRAVNSFLGHMEINNKDYFYLLDFCDKFDELIGELNKGTVRSFTILQEFFANETGKIAHNLRNFDNLFRELKSVLNDEKMVMVNSLIEKVQNLEAKSKQKINMDVDLRNSEASLKIANNEKDSIMAEIIDFNQSDEHNNFLALKDERKSKEKAFYDEQDIILQSFAVLDRPLRKYSHIAFEHEELVLDYLNDPIEALSNDKELKIIQILKKLEQKLNENTLNVDDRKKEKSIEEIRKLSKEFVQSFARKYFSFKSEIEEIDNKIRATGVSEKLRDLNKKLDDINLRIEKNSEEYSRLKSDASRMGNSIANLKSQIENSVRNMFGDEIKINT